MALAGRAKLRVREGHAGQTKLVTVFARKTATFAGPGQRDVTLVLSRDGRQALRPLSKVRLAIDGSATGEAGEAASGTVSVTLAR